MSVLKLPLVAALISAALPLSSAVEIGGIGLRPGPNDQVSVSRKDWSWRSGAESFPALNIAMDSGRAAYTIRHDLVTSAGTLGFCVPTTCNWYQSGMISVMLNGKRLDMAGTDGESIELKEGLDRGSATFSWSHPEADIAFTFVLPRGLNRIYVEARLTPHIVVEALSVRLLNYPAGFNREPKHVLHTAERTAAQTGHVPLAFPADDALLFCDTTLDVAANPKGAGPCAVVLGQDGLQAGRVRLGGYGTTTELTYTPETRRMRFCFWEFAGMSDANALASFRASIPAARKDLLAETLDDVQPYVVPASSAVTAVSTKPTSTEPKDNLFEDLSTTLRTPHFGWAPDIPGPPIDAVVIAPAYGQRDAVELMQRFDITCHPAMTWTRNRLAGIGYGDTQFFTPGAVATRFDQALAPHRDLIIIGGLEWDMLHVEHRQRILEHVHDGGAGVIVVQPSDNRELRDLFSRSPEPVPLSVLHGIPWESLTTFPNQTPAEIVKAGRFGKGRWVSLNYSTNSTNQSLTPRPRTPCLNPWEYEYHQALLGRAVLWAANRELPVSVELDAPVRAPVTASPLAVGLHLVSHPEDASLGELTIELTAHHLGTDSRRSAPPVRTQLANGKVRVSPELPWVAGGRVILTARVLSGKQTVGWSSRAMELIPPTSVKSMGLTSPSYSDADDVTGTAILGGDLAAVDQVRFSLRDSWGRLLATQTGAPDDVVRFSFPRVVPTATSDHVVTCALVDDAGHALVSQEIEFGITGRERPAFHLAIWEENETDYVSSLWYRRFRELGVDAIFYRNDRGNIDAAARLIARAGLFSAPMFTPYSPKTEKGESGPVHTMCANHTGMVETSKDRTREVARNWSRFGVLHYCDGSDKHMHGNCFCEYTLSALRKHLREAHGDLATLNDAWKTSFPGWDAVIPDTLTKARERGHFRSWLDHTRFMESSYGAYNRAMRDALAEIDPGVPMGPDGYGRMNSVDGSDWWQLLQTFSFYNLYTYQDPPQLEITRSLADHLQTVELRSLYYGSYTNQFGNDVFLRTIPWYALLHGYNGLFWWSANGKTSWAFSNGRLAGPDFRATRSYLQSRKGIDAVRDGLVHLIRRAKRDHNGIAIYYDQTAIHAATAYSHPSNVVRSCQSFEKLIEDVGYQYNYVTPDQITDDHLSEGGFRILILPHTLAMDADTASAIHAFATNGGVVLADTLPARYDENLDRHPAGEALADLFEAPGHVQEAGKGMGLLVAEETQEYWRSRTRGGGPTLRAAFRELLDQHAVPPEAVVLAEEDAGHVGLEVVVYRTIDARYIGVINRGDAVRSKLQLAAPCVVHDLRRRQGLGRRESVDLGLAPGDVAFFAVYPAALPDVELKPTSTATLGAIVHFSGVVETGPQVHRTLSLTVKQPDGRERPEYAKVLEATTGAAYQFDLPLALNDPPGEWQIIATDAITGKKRTIPLTVVPR